MKIKNLIILFILLSVLMFAIFFASAKDDGKKVAYITFDDGPTLNTPHILETLEKYNARATFFVLEERITMYPDFIRQIVAGGNSIGLHGVSHSEKIYSSSSSPLEEMNKANASLEKITGKKSRLVRVPFGSYYRLTDVQAKILEDNGYLIWDWNVDPRDSVGTIVRERVLSNLKKDLKRCKEEPVILFHDRKSTANLLEDALIYLKSEGYELMPLSEKQTPLNQLG